MVVCPQHRHLYLGRDQIAKDPDGDLWCIYAVGGSPAVAEEFRKIIDDYFPEKGLDGNAAVELNKQIDARVKYYIDAPTDVLKGIRHDYGGCAHELKGKVEIKDGKKWITVPDAGHANGFKNADIKSKYPAKVLMKGQADMPFLAVGEPLTLKVTDTLEIKCIHVPAGKFLMGKSYWMSGQYAEEPPHLVALTKSYYMSETVVTQELYEAIMGEVASPPKPDPNLSIEKNPKLPVVGVDNPHMDKFFKLLSEKTGKKTRLPTAAEWEYAARCGTSNPPWVERYRYQDSRDPIRKGYWRLPLPVKSKKPNVWGFYDMISSLWEIVGDTALAGTLDIVETVDPFHPLPPGKVAHNAYGLGYDITETSAGEVPGDEGAGHYTQRFRIAVEE